jgi:esterase/lipase superfamily enzyme
MSLLLAACVTGPKTIGQIARADANAASSEQVLVVTTRQPSPDKAELFSGDRSDSLHFADMIVSVPLNREPGTVSPPKGKPDLAHEFGVTSATLTDDEAAFASRLHADLAKRPAGQRSVFIFIHGYNVSFAKGLFLAAQIHHDYKVPGISLHYSWPSAQNAALYLYDRDSAEFARGGLTRTLKIAAAAKPESIIVLAHSMGTFVTMEALRTLAMTGDTKTISKIDALILAAPDIDVDVFRTQLASLTTRPKTMIVLVSEQDKALKLSGELRGGRPRVGAGANKEELAAEGLIVLDVATLRKKGDKLSHSTFANSEILINLVNGGLNLAAIERAKAQQAGVIGDSLGIAGDLLSSIVYLPAKIVGAR